MNRVLKPATLAALTIVFFGTVTFLVFAPGYVDRERNVVMSGGDKAAPAAVALHEQLLIADLHADTLLWKRSLLGRQDRGHVDLERLKEGNVALQVFAAVTKSPRGMNYASNSADALDNVTLLAMGQLWPPRTWRSLTERALYQAGRLERYAARDDSLVVIRTRGQLERLLKERSAGALTVGGILGIEGAHALDGELANIDRLYAAGYRVIGLHHFFDNRLGGSLHGVNKAGLTDFGRDVVNALVTKGIMIDVAHSSPAVVRDVLAISDVPLIVSHTGIRGQCDSPRNIPDELVRTVAKRGGLIGIGYWKGAICDISPDGIADAIVAAIGVAGEEHVALGSDFDGSVTTSIDTSGLGLITDALLKRGVPEATIARVMGGNQVAFFREALPDVN